MNVHTHLKCACVCVCVFMCVCAGVLFKRVQVCVNARVYMHMLFTCVCQYSGSSPVELKHVMTGSDAE